MLFTFFHRIITFLLLYLLTSSAYRKHYESWDEMDSFTAIDHLSEEQGQSIDRIVFNYINEYQYISLGLLYNHELVLVRTYGKDRRGKTDVYASVSKPVTATIFFQILEDGMISSVDDPISDYSGKYRDAMPDEYMDTPVTFRHLLSHTSGIPHHDQIWKSGKFNLQFRPGSQTLYSTRGYGILGKVLCEITGMNYNQLVKTYIGDPINAESFSASSILFEAPGGLVKSTISDMALFAEAIMDNVFVSDTLQYGIQWVPEARDQGGELSLGWYITNYPTDSIAVYHAGSNGAPRAFIALRPMQSTGVVLMGRRISSDGSQLFYELARELMQHYKSQIVY